jgi:hypothetical protein
MTKIDCKISDLEEICKMVSLKGVDTQGKEYVAIPDFLATAEADKIRVVAMDSGGHFALDLSYKIFSVEEAGPIPIGDVEKFQDYLSRFDGDDKVVLTTTENQIVLERDSPKKTARMPKADSETITTYNGAEQQLSRFKFGPDYPSTGKTTLDLKMKLKSEDVKKAIDDGEVVKQRTYPWVVKSGLLTITVGEEKLGQIETEIKPIEIACRGETPNAKTCFAKGLDNVFNAVSGDIAVYLANTGESCPMYLQKTTEKFSLTVLLAPAVEVE